MFQTNCFDHKNPLTYAVDNQNIPDGSSRQKLHRLLTENFQLREIINRMEKTLQIIEEEKNSLKQQLRIALDEMTAADKLIDSYKNTDMELHSVIKKLELQLMNLQHQLQAQKQAIVGLLEHNKNLQTENKLVVQIKQRYNSELSKSKYELDYQMRESQKLQANNDILSAQITKLLGSLNYMQQQINCRRHQLQDYESFVLQKVGEAKVSPEMHKICSQQYDKLHAKYIKYKQKSHNYKHERDQLQLQLQHISKQIDSNTLRKYFQEIE